MTSNTILQLIKDLNQQLRVTSVVVTHDLAGAFEIADRIALLNNGEIIFVGTPDEMKTADMPLVKKFLAGGHAGQGVLMQLSPEIKAGVTVLLSIILFATMAMAVGRIDFKRGESVELTLSYQNVDGLLEGAPVRYAGVNVGNVTAVQLASSAVLVQIRLDRELIIPADSRFVIATSGVLGDKYIEISRVKPKSH